MKKVIRYNLGTIPKKLIFEFRMTFDDSDRFHAGLRTNIVENGDTFIQLQLFPIINITIFRENIQNADGIFQRKEFDPNDNLLLTRYSLPIFINNLERLMQDFKIPELYHFIGNRLEVNDKLQKEYKRVFMINRMAISLIPVVIEEGDVEHTYHEGISMEFNSENNNVLLTLDDISSLLYILKNINMDIMAIELFNNFIQHRKE